MPYRLCRPDHNWSDPSAQSSSAIPAGLAPYTFPQATSTSPLFTSLWSQAAKQLFWRAATQLSDWFMHFRLPPTSPATPVTMMNRPVCHIVWIQPFCCRERQPGAVCTEYAAPCLAWMPGTAGRADALSSAVSLLLWIWRGYTKWDSGHGRPLQEQNDGQRVGRHTYSKC